MFLLMCACPLKSKENVCIQKLTLVCAEHAGGCDYMYDDIDSLQSN